MKKILSILLLLSMLLCTFCACGDKDKEEGVKALSGEVGEELYEEFVVDVDYEPIPQRLPTKCASFSEYKEEAEGKKDNLYGFYCVVKNSTEFEGKEKKKLSFTIEADRDVSVCFGLFGVDLGFAAEKTVDLKANTPTKVELEYDDGEEIGKTEESRFFAVQLFPDEAKTYYKDKTQKEYVDGFDKWSKTKYIITEFDVFVK